MQFIARFKSDIFNTTPDEFSDKALAAFRFQSENCPVYRDFLHYLDIRPDLIRSINEIPFLPAELFKTHQVITGSQIPEAYFESSGTTVGQSAKHFIADMRLYNASILAGFKRIYGDPKQYCLLALLPSYLERKHASLVHMCQTIIEAGTLENSGFYLNEWEKLRSVLLQNEANKIPTILIGVAFALLDMSELIPMRLQYTTIIETGGMKGRKKEITREELHDQLKQSFQVASIHSEYGMTELLSQAYSTNSGRFFCPQWMYVSLRDPEDPLSEVHGGSTGCLNIIDLANIHSCCFIATQDLGKQYADGGFEVLGRFDNSDVRGCNLMLNEH